MYECDGYDMNQCTQIVPEAGLWHMDGMVFSLCKVCEAAHRKDGAKLVRPEDQPTEG